MCVWNSFFYFRKTNIIFPDSDALASAIANVERPKRRFTGAAVSETPEHAGLTFIGDRSLLGPSSSWKNAPNEQQ